MTRSLCLSALAVGCLVTPGLADSVAVDITIGQFALGTKVNGGATLGWEFDVSQDITVTQLGVFDDNGDGLVQSHDVGIWTDGGALLVQGTVPDGAVGTLAGQFRYVPVTSTLLEAGNTYRIGNVYLDNTPDLFPTGVEIVTANPALSFSGRAQSAVSNVLTFPDFLGGNNFFGPNFQFTVPEPSTLTAALLAVVIGTCAGTRRRVSGV